MSTQNVEAFFEKVEKDEGLQKKLKALAEKGEAQNKALVAELVKLAEDAGIKFTAADFAEVRKQKLGELSPGELAKRISEENCNFHYFPWCNPMPCC